MSRVSLSRCAGYGPEQVGPALDRLLEPLGGLAAFVRRGDRVLLKPNFVAGQSPDRAATTHPGLVEPLLARLADLGARPRIGDSPAFDSAAGVAAKCGIGEVAARYGVPIVEFSHARRKVSRAPKVAREFVIDAEVLDADVVINLPKLKSHRQLGFSASLKNLYGCMPGKRKAYYHFSLGNRDADFARMVAAFAHTVAPHLNIVDAVLAMEREGPTGGDPRPLGFLAAGADASAVDTVLEAIIHAPLEDSLILNACRELRLGETRLDNIDVLGSTVRELAVPDFRHPLLIGVRFSPGRLARSVWRNFLITRFRYDPALGRRL